MLQTNLTQQSYALSDRYDLNEGRVFMTGTQALVRVMLDQARRDRQGGLNTAGFISGYRGSPLGALDMELWRIKTRLEADRVEFMPAVNEDLGAAAVLGAQQAVLDVDCQVQGIFSMWYGKGPGVDRSGDALRHGNAYGSSPKGGVLVVAGDDHGCVSSSMPHQSDVAFMNWFMPTLHPASVGEYQAFGEYGFALSRFSGIWVGFKAISETVESGRSVMLHGDRRFVVPPFEGPPGGLHVRRADLPSAEIETRIGYKLQAVEAFVEANPIDRRIYDIEQARFGIVTTGKGHLDLMEALRLLELDEARCRELGIDIYKVAMVWPLARRDALAFVRGKREVLVIEEKRGLIESQFKEYFYDWPGDKPERMVGKHDAQSTRGLVPWTGELSPLLLVPIVAERLHRHFPGERLLEKARALTKPAPIVLNTKGAVRMPYFCSGCPHNTSTRLPQGSRAGSGIGCHVMASWMNRDTEGYSQMGGEGVPWVASSKFNGGKHIFQNLGEGTWYHSGSLAIRQAVAAATNITYKILYNDAVAMTGGQPVDGPVSVSGIAQTCRAEGVERIAVISDNIDKFNRRDFPDGTRFHDRLELDLVQRQIRQVKGVSVLIYEQTCAAEKRRRRKRGTMEDPKRFAWINALVCEGCGDCSLESNCLSIEPLETEFGRKRKINLSSCNKDFSCLGGFCPAFVTIEGGERKKRKPAELNLAALVSGISEPKLPSLNKPYDLLVTGVGGTGVITVGALISIAAHIEGHAASELDFTGFAQKFGTVLSYIRLCNSPEQLNQVRIEKGAASAVIGCDIVVSSSPKASFHYRQGTKIVLNTAAIPTAEVVLQRDADLRIDVREQAIRDAVGSENVSTLEANRLSEELLGDAVFANIIMLGFAWQQGLVPVTHAALDQAIALNGVEVDRNKDAFSIGRLMADAPESLARYNTDSPKEVSMLSDIIEQRVEFLTGYLNRAYAARYANRIANFRNSLPNSAPNSARDGSPDELIGSAAKSLFKLMAYKDEYEVARLHSSTAFNDELNRQFTGNFKVHHHLAPPVFSFGKASDGRPRKIAFGSWIRPVMGVLARVKGLRGTPFDPFGYTSERRMNRDLISWYESCLDKVAACYTHENHDHCLAILQAPLEMRGYGPVWRGAVESERQKVEIGMQEMMSVSR